MLAASNRKVCRPAFALECAVVFCAFASAVSQQIPPVSFDAGAPPAKVFSEYDFFKDAATQIPNDGLGSALVCTLPPGYSLPAAELKTSFMRPAKLGPIFATGRVVFKGRSIGCVEGTLRDEAVKLIATASATMRIISPQPERESS